MVPKTNEEHNSQKLATFVHGALTFGHALGVLYNFKRKNYGYMAAHAAAAAFDMYCTFDHMRDNREYDNLLKEPRRDVY